jgi:hypothetical protein
MGAQASQIILNTTSANLTINVSYGTSNSNLVSSQIVLRDFNIACNVAGQGNGNVGALNVLGSPNIGSPQPNCLIDNVTCYPWASGAYPTVGMYLRDIRGGVVRACRVLLQAGGLNGSGFVYTSTNNGSTGNAPCNFEFSGCQVVWGNVGIELRSSGASTGTNDWEGVMISNCVLINNNYAIYANSSDGTGGTAMITNCITNSNIASIWLNNISLCNIHGNYLQCSANNSIGVRIGARTGGVYATVIGNFTFGAGHTGCIGVQAAGTGNVIASNNGVSVTNING